MNHATFGAALLAAALVVGCGGDPFSGGDAIMLSDNTRMSRGESGWVAEAPGVTANVIQAHPTTRDAFDEIADGTLVFEGVGAWRSNEGATRITLRSSVQTGTAQYDGSGYTLTGLTGGPAFAESDTLTVTGDEGVEVTVAAPPAPADPASLLGEPAGLGTRVRIADGTFDTLYVFVLADGDLPGDAGLMRFVSADDMRLEGGERSAPLLDDTATAALDERGLTPVAVYFALYNEIESTEFFGGSPVPVQAGRMFQLDPADL